MAWTFSPIAELAKNLGGRERNPYAGITRIRFKGTSRQTGNLSHRSAPCEQINA